jgi:hypothetical protein
VTRRVGWAAAALATALLVAACAAGASGSAASPPGSASGPANNTPVLVRSAVPGLPETTRPLTVAVLSKETTAPVAAALAASGYLGGSERTFQVPSKQLSLVVSRSFVFRSPSGAATFLAFVKEHSDTWFGGFGDTHAVVSAGRRGWVFRPADCACHLANPVLVGVVLQGDHLAWLEINGPAATEQRLLDLLQPSKSAPPAQEAG